MKRLTTIVLAVLMLCLQAFSGTVAYGAEEEDNIQIWDRKIIQGNPPISQNEKFVYKLTLQNKNNTDDLHDIVIDIDSTSSFYYYGATASIDEIKKKEPELRHSTWCIQVREIN
jgi:hypothetical protein